MKAAGGGAWSMSKRRHPCTRCGKYRILLPLCALCQREDQLAKPPLRSRSHEVHVVATGSYPSAEQRVMDVIESDPNKYWTAAGVALEIGTGVSYAQSLLHALSVKGLLHRRRGAGYRYYYTLVRERMGKVGVGT